MNSTPSLHPHAAKIDFNQNPYMVVWEITRGCSLACRHCRASAQYRRHPEELSSSEAIKFIDQVERAKPQLLIITGGDPMLRPDLAHVIQYSSRKGFRVALSPSATPRLLKTDFSAIKQMGINRMSLSIDGPDQKSHDAFRGVDRTWRWTMEAVEMAKAAGIELQINTTMTKQNIKRFNEFLPLLQQIKPVTWSVFMLVPTGRGKKEDLIKANEVEDLFNKLYDLSKQVPYAIKTTEGQHYRRVCIQRSGQNPSVIPVNTMGVNDGKGFVFVSHTGEVCPSGFLPSVAGNVRHNELIDIYRNDPMFKQLRDPSALKGKCGYCEFNAICGGSRARAYAMTGDYLEAEPFCVYQPKKKKELSLAAA